MVKSIKGTWWMPWDFEPKKDVENCDKPRGGVNQPLIRGSPNGVIHPKLYSDTHC